MKHILTSILLLIAVAGRGQTPSDQTNFQATLITGSSFVSRVYSDTGFHTVATRREDTKEWSISDTMGLIKLMADDIEFDGKNYAWAWEIISAYQAIDDAIQKLVNSKDGMIGKNGEKLRKARRHLQWLYNNPPKRKK